MKTIKTHLFAIALVSLGTIISCNTPNQQTIDIPEGQYALSGQRPLITAAECGMTDMTFGNTLMITGGKIETHPMKGMETVQYVIRKIGDNEYMTTIFRPVMGDSTNIQFSLDPTSNQLKFLCSTTPIVYQKQ